MKALQYSNLTVEEISLGLQEPDDQARSGKAENHGFRGPDIKSLRQNP